MNNGLGRVRLVVGFAISIIFIWLVLRRVAWAEFWVLCRSLDWVWLLAGVFVFLVVYGVNAYRWRWMFVGQNPPSLGQAFSFIMIGHMFNSFLPFRAGDILRGALLGRREGVSVSLVYGTMTLERLLDIAVLLGMALWVSRLAVLPQEFGQAVMVLAVLGGVAFLGLVLLLRFEKLRVFLLWALTPLKAVRLVAERLLSNYLQGVQSLRDAGRVVTLLLLSVVSWGLVGCVFLVWFKAFGLMIPWYAGYLIVVLVNLGSAIPSSPGFVGVYHYMVYLSLSVWLKDASTIASFAIITHLASIILYVLVGSVCFFREKIDISLIKMIHTRKQHREVGL